MVTISYFATSTEKSLELYKLIESYCKEKGYNVSFIDASLSSQYDFLVRTHGDTLSIVDASIEMENGEYLPTVYPILTAQVNIFKHVLVASRTHIPMNICPRITGGFPNPLYEDKKENGDIEAWLKENIDFIVAKEIVHPSLRVEISSQDDLMDLKPQMEQMLENNLQVDKNDEKRKVLISYRSKYYGKVLDYLKSDLVERLKDNQIKKKYQFHIVQSRNEKPCEILNELSDCLVLHDRLCAENEAPTPMQRWRMVGQLEDLIKEMDEVWIYDTSDYGDSWWTQAEMVMTCYDNNTRSGEHKIQLKTMLKNSLPEFISKIDVLPEYRQKITRYLSNTRLDTMGPEAVKSNSKQLLEIADQIDRIPSLLRFLIKWNMKKVIKMSIPDTLPQKEKKAIMKEMIKLYMSPKELREYANDDVFKTEFWHTISYALSANSAKEFDLGKWISSPMDDLTSITDEELEEASLKGIITLKKQNSHVEMFVKKGKPYYLWLATRMGQANGETTSGLDIYHTYIIYDDKNNQSDIRS